MSYDIEVTKLEIKVMQLENLINRKDTIIKEQNEHIKKLETQISHFNDLEKRNQQLKDDLINQAFLMAEKDRIISSLQK